MIFNVILFYSSFLIVTNYFFQFFFLNFSSDFTEWHCIDVGCSITHLSFVGFVVNGPSFVLSQIVAVYAFNKTKYASDPDCDVDFETMRSVIIEI